MSSEWKSGREIFGEDVQRPDQSRVGSPNNWRQIYSIILSLLQLIKANIFLVLYYRIIYFIHSVYRVDVSAKLVLFIDLKLTFSY